MMSKKLSAMMLILSLMLALAACGGNNNGNNNNSSQSPEPSGDVVASEEIVVKASNWEFDQKEYKATKDTPIKITLENIQGAHGIEIKGTKVKLRNNESAVVTLAAGEYEIICNIACGTGHSQMRSKLIVA